MPEAVEVVRVKPKPGAEQRLSELRPAIEASMARDFPGRVSSELVVLDDGTWCDIWRWTDRTDADQAAATAAERYPEFLEWLELVDEISLDWGESPAWSNAGGNR